MQCLTVGKLIEKLKEFNEDLSVVITHESSGDSFAIKDDIFETDHAYFGNDLLADEQLSGKENFLSLGVY